MLRKTLLITTALLLSVCLAGIAMAEPTGSDRKGKYTYRNIYKACMERGEISTPKPLLNPDAKTMDQWKRLFESKNFEEFGCKQEWTKLDPKDVEDIYAYLYKHAADSPTPAKCK